MLSRFEVLLYSLIALVCGHAAGNPDARIIPLCGILVIGFAIRHITLPHERELAKFDSCYPGPPADEAPTLAAAKHATRVMSPAKDEPTQTEVDDTRAGTPRRKRG